jgi:Icc-related predicted phosphoesterase
MPRIVCISDTHNFHEKVDVPDGDVLIHAGDATVNGTIPEIVDFNEWLTEQPHRYKVLISGNHDWLYYLDNKLARELTKSNVSYLQDSLIEIDGLKIYGSPWQPRFFDWAFNLNRGYELAEKWAMVPDDIDILITHGPPYGILDLVPRKGWDENTGCEELRKRVGQIAAFGRLRLHVFGHIHCGYGVHEEFGVKFVNASTCDEQYNPTQPPIVIDLE